MSFKKHRLVSFFSLFTVLLLVGIVAVYLFFSWEEERNPSFDKKLPGQTYKRYTVGYIKDEDLLQYCRHAARKQESTLNVDSFKENEPLVELHCIDTQKSEYLRVNDDDVCNYIYDLPNANYAWRLRECTDGYYTYFYK